MRRIGIVLGLLVLAALACSVEFSTAHFADARMVKDAAGEQTARTYRPTETFFCLTELKDADGEVQVKAVWRNAENTVSEETITTGNGNLHFEAEPPAEGWEKGGYSLELWLEGDKKKTLTFTVK